jgi:hypothetical protein
MRNGTLEERGRSETFHRNAKRIAFVFEDFVTVALGSGFCIKLQKNVKI